MLKWNCFYSLSPLYPHSGSHYSVQGTSAIQRVSGAVDHIKWGVTLIMIIIFVFTAMVLFSYFLIESVSFKAGTKWLLSSILADKKN